MEINETNIDIFTKDLKKVAQLDALISETKGLLKPLQTRLKELKIERKELEKEICPTMVKNDFRIAELPNHDGKIEYKVKEAMVPMTQSSVKEKILFFFKEGPASLLSFNSKKSEQKALELFDFIYAKKNREFVKKEELKLTKN